MTILTRCALTVLSLLGALTLLGGVRPQWASALGLEWGDLPGLVKLLVEEHRRGENMSHYSTIVARRVFGKDEITKDLVAGHLTLLEATARFRKLEGETREYICHPRGIYRGDTDEERLCRQVINWAAQEASDSVRDELVRKLEGELREHLRDHNGRVELPGQ